MHLMFVATTLCLRTLQKMICNLFLLPLQSSHIFLAVMLTRVCLCDETVPLAIVVQH